MNVSFPDHPEVRVGLSEKGDGSMVWFNQRSVSENVRTNRDQYFVRQGINPQQVVAGGCAHLTIPHHVDNQDAGLYLLNADALITNVPNIFLSITVADCLPVFFFDPENKSIGIAHAGWKGLIGEILENTIRSMEETYGSSQHTMQAILGPHIKSCHFEVGVDVANQFSPQHIYDREGHLFADITAEASQRIQDAGVRSILDASVCTFCESHRLYSARHDKLNPLEGMVAYIGLETT